MDSAAVNENEKGSFGIYDENDALSRPKEYIIVYNTLE